MNCENLDKLKKDLNTLREDLRNFHCNYFAECDGCVLEEYDRGNPAAMFDKIKTNCDSHIRSRYGQTYADDILDWIAKPYRKPILDEDEKKYLSDVIRPFRKNVINICKLFYYEGNKQYISIQVRYESGYSDYVNLLNFNADTMYKGMETDMRYSPNELDLWN